MSQPFHMSKKQKQQNKAELELAYCDEYMECIETCVEGILWKVTAESEPLNLSEIRHDLDLIKVNAKRILKSYGDHVAKEFEEVIE